MTPTLNINLMKAKNTDGMRVPREFVGIFAKVTYGSLLTLIVIGILISAAYVYLHSLENRYSAQKKVLADSIVGDTTKEGILLVVKGRAGMVTTILSTQRNIRPLFDVITSVVPPGQLESFSFDENNKVVIVAHVQSLTQIITMVDALQKIVAQNQAAKPELISLTIARDGGYAITLAYIAKF